MPKKNKALCAVIESYGFEPCISRMIDSCMVYESSLLYNPSYFKDKSLAEITMILDDKYLQALWKGKL